MEYLKLIIICLLVFLGYNSNAQNLFDKKFYYRLIQPQDFSKKNQYKSTIPQFLNQNIQQDNFLGMEKSLKTPQSSVIYPRNMSFLTKLENGLVTKNGHQYYIRIKDLDENDMAKMPKAIIKE